MAEKRMYSKKITDSDAFIEMASSTQALYFHLNQGADDDGFNNQIQNAMFKAHASIDDLKVLLTKNFVMRFESGVVVIKHWWIHNTLRKDRYVPTNFQEELKLLGIKENKAYTLSKDESLWLPNGCQMVATDKISIDKGSIEEDKKEKDKEKDDTLSIPYQYDIYENYTFSDKVKDSIDLWLSYKKERKQTYKDTGLKVLLNRLQKDYDTYGEQYVIDSIESSIASNYQGIFAPKNKEKPKPEEKKCEYNFDSIYAEGTL